MPVRFLVKHQLFVFKLREKYCSPPEIGSDFQFGHQSFNFLNWPSKVSISFNSSTFSQNALNSDFFFPKIPLIVILVNPQQWFQQNLKNCFVFLSFFFWSLASLNLSERRSWPVFGHWRRGFARFHWIPTNSSDSSKFFRFRQILVRFTEITVVGILEKKKKSKVHKLKKIETLGGQLRKLKIW